jgi:hypothetical protein
MAEHVCPQCWVVSGELSVDFFPCIRVVVSRVCFEGLLYDNLCNGVNKVNSVHVVSKPSVCILMKLEAKCNRGAAIEFNVAVGSICMPVDFDWNSEWSSL